MRLWDAERSAKAIFGNGCALMKLNGECIVTRRNKELGRGRSWLEALRNATLSSAGVETKAELSARQLEHKQNA